MDGIYIVKTSLGEPDIEVEQVVSAYKKLSKVERAFRSIKTTSLRVRPIYVYSENHVREHLFLSVLAYYVEWHMRMRLAPVMFEDDGREGAGKNRSTHVERDHWFVCGLVGKQQNMRVTTTPVRRHLTFFHYLFKISGSSSLSLTRYFLAIKFLPTSGAPAGKNLLYTTYYAAVPPIASMPGA